MVLTADDFKKIAELLDEKLEQKLTPIWFKLHSLEARLDKYQEENANEHQIITAYLQQAFVYISKQSDYEYRLKELERKTHFLKDDTEPYHKDKPKKPSL